jgi:hypothetical protein
LRACIVFSLEIIFPQFYNGMGERTSARIVRYPEIG